jgi:hypothetical protein
MPFLSDARSSPSGDEGWLSKLDTTDDILISESFNSSPSADTVTTGSPSIRISAMVTLAGQRKIRKEPGLSKGG